MLLVPEGCDTYHPVGFNQRSNPSELANVFCIGSEAGKLKH